MSAKERRRKRESLAALGLLLNYWGSRLLCSHWTWTRADEWTLTLLSLLPFFHVSHFSLSHHSLLFCLPLFLSFATFCPIQSSPPISPLYKAATSQAMQADNVCVSVYLCFQAFGGLLVHSLEADWRRADKRSSAAQWMFNGTNCEYLMRGRESHMERERCRYGKRKWDSQGCLHQSRNSAL